MAQNSEVPSDFAGFALPGAAFTLNAVSKISQSDIEQAKANLAPVRANAAQGVGKTGTHRRRAGSSQEARRRPVRRVQFDDRRAGAWTSGMSLVLDPDAVTYVAGLRVGDTAKLDSLIKALANEVTKEKPKAAEHDQAERAKSTRACGST